MGNRKPAWGAEWGTGVNREPGCGTENLSRSQDGEPGGIKNRVREPSRGTKRNRPLL